MATAPSSFIPLSEVSREVSEWVTSVARTPRPIESMVDGSAETARAHGSPARNSGVNPKPSRPATSPARIGLCPRDTSPSSARRTKRTPPEQQGGPLAFPSQMMNCCLLMKVARCMSAICMGRSILPNRHCGGDHRSLDLNRDHYAQGDRARAHCQRGSSFAAFTDRYRIRSRSSCISEELRQELVPVLRHACLARMHACASQISPHPRRLAEHM